MLTNIKLYLAPFQGITGHIYREVYSRHFKGIDKFYTPFFTGIHKKKSLDSKSSEIAFKEHHGVPLVPQILSKDTDEIIRFAQYCNDRGFNEINWNLGCPYPRVANKKRGSGLLPHPELVTEILDKVMSSINLNLSVKCRLGYFSPDEIEKLVPIFNQIKISELTIHARIGKQLYKGEVDLDHFEKALEIAEVPVVYNGDIFSVKNFNKKSNQFKKVSAWMIGRGLLMDPFLPEDIKGVINIEDVERKTLIRNFSNDLYYAYRKNKNDNLHVIGTMKEFWSHLSKSFNEPLKVFNKIKKTKTFDDYEDIVNEVFEKYNWEIKHN